MPCPEPGGRCRAGVDGGNAIAAALEAQSRGRDHGTAFASPTRTARVATDACRTAVAYRGRLYRLRPGCGSHKLFHVIADAHLSGLRLAGFHQDATSRHP